MLSASSISCSRRVTIASGSSSTSVPAQSSRNLAATASNRNPDSPSGKVDKISRQSRSSSPHKWTFARTVATVLSVLPDAARPDAAHVRQVGIRPQVQGRPRIRKPPQTATRAVFGTVAAEQDHQKRIAVGTGLRVCGLDRPPHRSQRAGLPHWGRDRNQARAPHEDHAPTGHVS
jgi:hypothetical protein